MFDDATQVIRALIRYPDVFDPKTGSILYTGNGTSGVDDEPFHQGFISGFEERAELVRRLRRLEPRERRLLYLWYMESLPIGEIGRNIGVSRVHCYRLRNRALSVLAASEEDATAVGA